MAIKVILRGDLFSPPQRLACKKCASILEYTSEDLRAGDGWTGVWYTYFEMFADCPVCGNANWVRRKEVKREKADPH